MARLNNIAAIAYPPNGNMEHTVRSRKIGNGYMVETSSYNPTTGEYKCDEQYSEGPPMITPPGVNPMPRGNVGAETLSDTKKYMSEKG